MAERDRRDEGADREAILARRAIFVASTLGGLGVVGTHSTAAADSSPVAPASSGPRTRPTICLSFDPVTDAPTAPTSRGPSRLPPKDPDAGPRVCLSPPYPERSPHPSRAWGGEAGPEFWLPLGSLGSPRPPVLLGVRFQGFFSWSLSNTLDLRLGPTLSLVGSSRGSLLPLGFAADLQFSSLPGFLTTLGFEAGALLAPFSYETRPTDRSPAPSPYLRGNISPFGFRFGPDDRGILALRFAAVLSRVDEGQGEHWTLSFMPAGVSLGYLF